MITKNVKVTASTLILRSQPALGETDTGSRLVRNQKALSLGISHDGKWHYVMTTSGNGWVSAQYLEPAVDAPTVDRTGWPPVPRTRDEIVQIFGAVGAPVCSSGRASLPMPLSLAWAPSKKVMVVACHVKMVKPFEAVFAEIQAKGLWHLLEDFGGIFADRPIAGSTRPSTHSWGISIDINTRTNPLGAQPRMDPRLIVEFESLGFAWGGRWRRPDGMHFQYAAAGV